MSCLAPGLGDYISRENSTCTMGGLSQYIVNVSSGESIPAALKPLVSPASTLESLIAV